MSYENIKFKEYIKAFGWSGLKMSKFMGLDYTYYRKRTQNKRVSVPIWVKMFNKGWEMRDKMWCGCEKKIDDPSGSE